MPVDTEGALAWLYARQKFGIRPGLTRTKRTLAALSNPERNLRFIHVAGTNGKGSVCATIASILAQQFRVGLFVSPGFDGLRGRFFISGEEVSPARLPELAARVRIASEQATPDDPLTEFEVLTIMAICYFADEDVDMVVWETGLGGTFDSTNVVIPEVSVITNVSFDHQAILGNTIREIASQKAGIIKAGIPVVTGAAGEALDVIRAVAKTCGSPLYEAGIQFGMSQLSVSRRQQVIHYRGLWQDHTLGIHLLGSHQVQNAGIALAALELFMWKQPAYRLSWETIERGLTATHWPGRVELLEAEGRMVVLDGAHNPAGAKALRQTLAELADEAGLEGPAWTFIIGILADKAITEILKELVTVAKHIIVTQPNNPRALPVQDLYREVSSIFRGEISSADSVEAACIEAFAGLGPICCCGSLYTVFEARKTISEQFCLGQN